MVHMKHGLLLAALLLAGCAGQNVSKTTCSGTDVSYSFAGTTVQADKKFKRDFCLALIRVRGWWGPSFPGPFMVNTLESSGPSMALIPTWRGERGTMLFRFRPVERGTAAIIHELVHVYAPNANRFLAEGFAVYAQETLNGHAAYPNFGQDLHQAARRFLARADLTVLDGTATPTRLQMPGVLNGRESYIVAGSFMRFLIETHGMATFRRLYALTPLVSLLRDAGKPERWVKIYGKPLKALAADWRAAIR